MSKKRRFIEPMTALEKRAVFSLAGIFALRIFGLFLILPVFSLYAVELKSATPFLIGLTLGAYGLTQAMLQIPFGILSDRWSRKKTIVLGLLIFAFGSLVAAMSDSIYGVLLGRFLQGAGAISAAVIALMSDLTRETQRTKAMALIGVGIGFVFMASMVLGPILSQWIGVQGIFFLTALAALLAIPLLLKVTPEPKVLDAADKQAAATLPQMKKVLRNPQLLQLDFGIFALHASLTALFVVIPFQLIELGGLEQSAHWKIYVSVMVIGVIGMLPFMAFSHQREKVPMLMKLAVLILCLAAILLFLGAESNWGVFLAGLALFFVGFNTMEATLPSLISRVAPIVSKGAAIGVYNSAQFLGVFVGGASSGWLLGQYNASWVFLFCFILLCMWLLLMFIAPKLKPYETKLVAFPAEGNTALSPQLLKHIAEIKGVIETSQLRNEAAVYIKVDLSVFDAGKFKNVTGQVF